MTIKVSINSTDVRNFTGVSAKTDKPFSMNFQTIWIHLSDRQGNRNPYPEKVEIVLEKNEAGAALFYPVGEYELSDSSVYVDRLGYISLRPVLVAPSKARTTTPV